ncbi:hypothetical protein Acr_23g0015400 [Actinidia rufa]|uniref:Uncharacterized protein n=1 Tax=Actinidia rufa TaxID=165716 RepID=A0A7J0GQQ9_9ERIC|nr:hypothetical protein Acr_23g0015400 [Actinidia rufa]
MGLRKNALDSIKFGKGQDASTRTRRLGHIVWAFRRQLGKVGITSDSHEAGKGNGRSIWVQRHLLMGGETRGMMELLFSWKGAPVDKRKKAWCSGQFVLMWIVWRLEKMALRMTHLF